MLFIPIPSTRYTATVKGSAIKNMTCEKCGHAYSYSMFRIVSGFEKVLFSSSRGPEKALKKAQANLAKVLEIEHDDVPCPACKWHQSSHVAYARSQLYPQLKYLAGAFFIFAGLALGLILFVNALGILLLDADHKVPKTSSILQFAIIVLVIATPGLLLRGFRRLLLLNYRPNG